MDRVVIAALNYQKAKDYHEENPGNSSALFEEEYRLELLEDAIDAEFVERNKAT